MRENLHAGMPRKIAWVLVVALAAGVFGAEPFYMGTWKITSAVVAPWWDDPVHKPDPSEVKMLVGKTVTFEAKRIVGPRPLICNELKYRVRNYPADFLFQGEFGEMHLRDKTVDAAKVAASVGFSKGKLWKTVETGCANELDSTISSTIQPRRSGSTITSIS